MNQPAEANAPTPGEGVKYHIRCKEGDLPPHVLLPGDPDRTYRIAKYWDEYEDFAFYREYRTLRGTYKGMPIATTSTGIGTPAGEICLHELSEVGVKTGIRVGTTGSISPDFDCGDLIIPVAGLRRDGTTDLYVPKEFPAFANVEVVMALVEACQRLGFSYGLGLVCCTASFYLGQGRPLSKDGYWPSWADAIIPDLQAAGVTNFDMDSTGLFVLGYLHGMRIGTIEAVIASRIHNTWGDRGGELRACQAASEALLILQEWDELKEKKGVKHFYPSLLQK